MKNDERIDLAVEGLLNEADFEQFQRDALADPELMTAFVRKRTLHGQLLASRDSLINLLEDESSSKVVSGPGRWLFTGLSAAAAAIVAAGLTWWIAQPESSFAPVATLIQAEGCRWAGSELPTAEGSRLPAGTLALVEGMATLKFDSGATITLEAPASLEVTSAMRCRLIEGSVVADVPESAHGFTIDAPDIKVIDWGTRFGLTANQFGQSHVMVFEGEVEVKKVGEDKSKRMVKGNTFVNGARQSGLELQEIARNTEPITPPTHDGWLNVSTAAGEGKDAFVRRGYEGGSGTAPLMMVKHTDMAPNNERRGFLTFDLRNVDRKVVAETELLLDVEPSGLGFSTLVPDSSFAVYGVIDDAADRWPENQINWNNAPAMTDSGLLSDKTRKLGTFEILRGASATAQIKVSSPELANFLREDANGLVTFLIVRESGEFESQGLVHAFATKEHPDAKPPTLRLKLSK